MMECGCNGRCHMMKLCSELEGFQSQKAVHVYSVILVLHEHIFKLTSEIDLPEPSYPETS